MGPTTTVRARRRSPGSDAARASGATLGLVGPAAPWAGGIPQFTTALAEELRKETTLDWLSWRPPRRLPPTTHLDPSVTPPGAVTPLLRPYDPRSWRAAGLRLRHAGAVVLTVTHPTLAAPYDVLARAYRRAASPRGDPHGRVVLLCHNVEDHEGRHVLRPLTRRLLGLADAVVVHAAAEVALVRRLAPHATVVEAFHPCYETWRGRPWTPAPARDRLLFFGYVRAYKGLGDLIEAMPLLPSATLDVVGRFEDGTEPYRAQVRRLGLDGRVHLDDRFVAEEEVPGVFDRADLLVAPYRQASQSGVVHLAYSLGRPVVATSVGGLREAVRAGETGLLVGPADPTALAAAIRRALAHGARGYAAGLRAVVADRSWSRYGDLILDAALGGGGGTAATGRTRSFTEGEPP